MNEGSLSIAVIITTILAAIYASRHPEFFSPDAGVRRRPPSRQTAPQLPRPAARRPAASVRRVHRRSAGPNDVQPRSGHQNAIGTSVQRSPNVQRSKELPASVDELRMLAEAIRLRAAGTVTTKQAAIEQAFKISKGGGDGWRRASALYDLAMGQQQKEVSS